MVLPEMFRSSENCGMISRAGLRSGCSLAGRARERSSPPRRGRGSVAGGAAPGRSAPACLSPSGAPVSCRKALPTPRWGSGSSTPCTVGCRPRLLTCAPFEFVNFSNPHLREWHVRPSEDGVRHPNMAFPRGGFDFFTNSFGAGGFGPRSTLVAHRFRDNRAPQNSRVIQTFREDS